MWLLVQEGDICMATPREPIYDVMLPRAGLNDLRHYAKWIQITKCEFPMHWHGAAPATWRSLYKHDSQLCNFSQLWLSLISSVQNVCVNFIEQKIYADLLKVYCFGEEHGEICSEMRIYVRAQQHFDSNYFKSTWNVGQRPNVQTVTTVILTNVIT